jgi:hypothetical protein
MFGRPAPDAESSLTPPAGSQVVCSRSRPWSASRTPATVADYAHATFPRSSPSFGRVAEFGDPHGGAPDAVEALYAATTVDAPSEP